MSLPLSPRNARVPVTPVGVPGTRASGTVGKYSANYIADMIQMTRAMMARMPTMVQMSPLPRMMFLLENCQLFVAPPSVTAITLGDVNLVGC